MPRQFAEKQAAARPKRWDTLELRFAGDSSNGGGGGVEFFEVRCVHVVHATCLPARRALPCPAPARPTLPTRTRLRRRQ